MSLTMKSLLLAAIAARAESENTAAAPAAVDEDLNVDELMKDGAVDEDKMKDMMAKLNETMKGMGGGENGEDFDLSKLGNMEELMKSLGGMEGMDDLLKGMGGAGSDGADAAAPKEGDDDEEDDADFAAMDQEEILKNLENLPEEGPLEAQVSATASHILVETEEDAKKLIEEITADSSLFTEKAKEVSKCPSGKEGGMLGAFGRGQMVPEFDEAVFSESSVVGSVMPEPVKTNFGYHVLRVEARGKASMARASHILVDSEEKALELKEKIGSDQKEFMKAAVTESKCPSSKQGGRLGEFSKGQMVPEFETAVFSEETVVGEVVGPIKTDFGYHLLLVTARVEASSEGAAEAKAEDAKAEEKDAEL